MYLSSAVGSINRRITVQPGPGIKRDPVSKISNGDGTQWLTSVILATQEAQIRRIEVQSQPWAKSL
jgi:hypothetical protein